MSVALQNNVRLRVFLIVIISLVIRATRINSSASVHKATGILENNFIVYGIVVLCSLLPFKATWIAAIIVQTVALLLDTAVVGLGVLATYRCRNQTGCIQTLPLSVLTLMFVLIVFILDIMQTWDIYSKKWKHAQTKFFQNLTSLIPQSCFQYSLTTLLVSAVYHFSACDAVSSL